MTKHIYKLVQVLQKICAVEMQQVFVYETLLKAKLRKKVLKRQIEDTFVDKLLGFREISIESVDGPDYHTLIVDKTDSVQGKRFYVTPEELKKLDHWEKDYSRKKVRLASGNEAWVYFLRIQDMADKGHNLN